MLRRELSSATGGHADDERNAELAARHVAQRGGIVDDLIQGEQAEVDRHHLHDRPHAADGCADARTDEGRLGERRVAHALRPELLEQSFAARVRAAVAAHILTHEEDTRIAP